MQIKGYQIGWQLPVLTALLAILIAGALLLLSGRGPERSPDLPLAAETNGTNGTNGANGGVESAPLPSGYDSLSAAAIIESQQEWTPAERQTALAHERATAARANVIAALSAPAQSTGGETGQEGSPGEEGAADTEETTETTEAGEATAEPGASDNSSDSGDSGNGDSAEDPIPDAAAPLGVPPAKVTVQTVRCRAGADGCEFEPLGGVLVEIRGPRDLTKRSDEQGKLAVDLPAGDYTLKAQGAPAVLTVKYRAAGGAVELQVVAR